HAVAERSGLTVGQVRSERQCDATVSLNDATVAAEPVSRDQLASASRASLDGDSFFCLSANHHHDLPSVFSSFRYRFLRRLLIGQSPCQIAMGITRAVKGMGYLELR